MAYTTIDDPSAYFQTTLFTGNDSARDITNGGNSDLQPDLIWVTSRSHGYNRGLFDSSRGVQKEIISNGTNGEATLTAGVSAFNSDGYSYNGANYNTNSYTFVAWQWKVNGGTKTTITESGNNPGGTYQVNTTSGISILDYVGTGAQGTIAHGLGKKPEAILIKDRSADGDNWFVYHSDLTASDAVRLDTTDATAGDANRFANTEPTTSVITFGASGGTNDDGNSTTAYAFNSVKGYSRFGAFNGNNNSDGTFVYLGFKPAWIMIKNRSTSHSNHDWIVFDTARHPLNPNDAFMKINENSAETTSGRNEIDVLSNGFKCRSSYGDVNGGDGSAHFLYFAFASQPFVSSEGVPATAGG